MCSIDGERAEVERLRAKRGEVEPGHLSAEERQQWREGDEFTRALLRLPVAGRKPTP